MTETSTALPAPRDNLLGICHALGEALGFDANYLRITLAALLLVGPQVALAAYALCGLVVLAERLAARMLPAGRHATA